MNIEKRDALCKKFHEECINIMIQKGKDYSPNDIAFEEVKQTAEELGIRPFQVLWVHLKKHYSAIKSYMKRGQVESEPIEERLKDLSNYCNLMNALIQEEKEEFKVKLRI